MNVTYEMWHDGLGYDLEALAQVAPGELPAIEKILIDHRPRDWRDIEALGRIDSPTARAVVEAALGGRDVAVRRVARQYVGEREDPSERERALIRSLESGSLGDGQLSHAIDEAAEFHPPGVIDALFRGALRGDPEAAVHFAALLMYVHGQASEPFDWSQRPFFLRFNTTDQIEREAAFRELCGKVGVDSAKYIG